MPNEWRLKIIAIPELIRAATESFFHHSSANRLHGLSTFSSIKPSLLLNNKKQDSKTICMSTDSGARFIDQQFCSKRLFSTKLTSSTIDSTLTNIISMNIE